MVAIANIREMHSLHEYHGCLTKFGYFSSSAVMGYIL